METKRIHPVVLAAAASVLLFALVGTAAVMGWLPNSFGDNAPDSPKQATSTSHSTQVARSSTRGVVEGVREIKQKGEGTGLGAVAGGVAGGVVGHQIGGGHGKDAMTVVGVVGGGLAGHEIEKRVRSTSSYVVDVRFDDGSTRSFTYADVPAFRAGDHVHVSDGALRMNS